MKMKKIVVSAFAAAALAAAAAWAADAALDREAAAECRGFEAAARTFGDVTVPEWCEKVPR